VSRYNDPQGGVSTETLLAWVTKTLGSLDPGASDYADWQGSARTLRENIKTETFNAAAQEWQNNRMSDAAYLALVTSRRDEINPASPDWDTWNRRLEDTTNQITNKHLAAADKADNDAWQGGHKSDASHMLYLQNRIAALPVDSPDRPGFVESLNNVKFSMAEDVLSYKVKTAKTDAARKVALRNLRDFDAAYRATLNPGSKAWRDADLVIRSLDVQLKSATKAGGGTGGESLAPVKLLPDKKDPAGAAIRQLGTAMTGFVSAGTDSRGMAEAILQGNLNEARRALGLPDEYGQDAGGQTSRTFLYVDPLHPLATTQQRDDQGRPIYIDAKGRATLTKTAKPAMTQGAFYLTATPEVYANLLGVKMQYEGARENYLWAKGDRSGAENAHNAWRTAGAQADKVNRISSGTAAAKTALSLLSPDGPLSLEARIQRATVAGDPATALSLALFGDETADAVINNPYAAYVDQSTITAITKAQTRITGVLPLNNDPTLSPINLNASTVQVRSGGQTTSMPLAQALALVDAGGPNGSAMAEAWRTGNAVVAATVLNPGWIHTVNPGGPAKVNGLPNWNYAYLDANDPNMNPTAVALLRAGNTEGAAYASGYRPMVTNIGGQLVPTHVATYDSKAVPGGVSPVHPSMVPIPGRPLEGGVALQGLEQTPRMYVPYLDEHGISQVVTVNAADILAPGALKQATFTGGDGKPYTAYSLDNFASFARSEAGTTPVIEWTGGPLQRAQQFGSDGKTVVGYAFFDGAGNQVFAQRVSAAPDVLGQDAKGVVRLVKSTVAPTVGPMQAVAGVALSGAVDWYGRGSAPVTMQWDPLTSKYVKAWQTAVWTGQTGEQATVTFGQAGEGGFLDMRPVQFGVSPNFNVSPLVGKGTAKDPIRYSGDEIIDAQTMREWLKRGSSSGVRVVGGPAGPQIAPPATRTQRDEAGGTMQTLDQAVAFARRAAAEDVRQANWTAAWYASASPPAFTPAKAAVVGIGGPPLPTVIPQRAFVPLPGVSPVFMPKTVVKMPSFTPIKVSAPKVDVAALSMAAAAKAAAAKAVAQKAALAKPVSGSIMVKGKPVPLGR
jgi:hypothetical protein